MSDKTMNQELIPIHEKLMLTIAEAAAYSNIGINRINAMLREAVRSCSS